MTNPPTQPPARCLSRAVISVSQLRDATGAWVNRQFNRYSSMATATIDKIIFRLVITLENLAIISLENRASASRESKEAIYRNCGEQLLKRFLFVSTNAHQFSPIKYLHTHAVMA